MSARLAVSPLLTAAETRHEDALRRSSGELRAERPDACAHASPDVEHVRLELARVQRNLDEERRRVAAVAVAVRAFLARPESLGSASHGEALALLAQIAGQP